MQIVIDIQEDVYKRIKFYKEFRDLNDCVATLKAIDNGTVLSNHGRLIDADELERAINRFESILYHTATILEAEKESK